MESKTIDLDIHTYGVHTSRFPSGIVLERHLMLVPCCNSLVLWDLKNAKREKVIHSNNSVIMCLLENENCIFSIAYEGEIVCIKKKTLKIVSKFFAGQRKVSFKFLLFNTYTNM